MRGLQPAKVRGPASRVTPSQRSPREQRGGLRPVRTGQARGPREWSQPRSSILSCKRILRLDPLLQEDLAPRSSLARGSCACSARGPKRFLQSHLGAARVQAGYAPRRSSRGAHARRRHLLRLRRLAGPGAGARPRAAAWRPVMHRRGVPGAMLTRARRTRRVRLVRGEGRGVST